MNSEQRAGLIRAGAILALVMLLVMAFRAQTRGGAYLGFAEGTGPGEEDEGQGSRT